jgi:7-cyano-7-deazaguanine synthase
MLAEMARSGHREIFPIYVRAGLLWERSELTLLRRFIGRLEMRNVRAVSVLELPMRDVAGGHWSVTGRGVPGYRAATSSNYILGRNLSLLAKAAIFCAHNRIGQIAMAPLESNPFPDARPEFLHALERAIQLGVGLKLKILTPYVGMTKAEVIRRGADLPLQCTLSCARPVGLRHCGACTKCAERIAGFREAGIPIQPATRADRRVPLSRRRRGAAIAGSRYSELQRFRNAPHRAGPARKSGSKSGDPDP